MTDEHACMCQEPSAAERRKPDAGREAAIEAAVDALMPSASGFGIQTTRSAGPLL